MITRALTCLAAVVCGASLTACGEMHNTIEPTASRAQPLSLELAAPADTGQLAVLAARSGGALTQAGVDLSVRAPTTPQSPLSDLESGRVDVAVVPEPEIMLARSQDDYVVGFGALTQTNADALVSLHDRHVDSLKALKGRTVGVTGQPYVTDLLRIALARAHVPVGSVRTVDVGFDAASALTTRQVAATFGPAGAALRSLRRAHRRADVRSVSSLGIPAYDGLVFVTRETFFAGHINLLRRFVQAIGRGDAAARADPASAVGALRDLDASLSAGAAPAAVTTALAATTPPAGEPWGWQSQATWNVFGHWMIAQHLITGAEAWYAASTNQLLAGQGP